jgi:hypothetical protein
MNQFDNPYKPFEYNDEDKDIPLAEGLKRVADYLRRHGWIQGDFATPDGCCIAGAITRAIPPGSKTAIAVMSHLRSKTASLTLSDGSPSLTTHVAAFNDAPGRTFAEVLEFLEQEPNDSGLSK